MIGQELRIRVEYQHARPKFNIGDFVFLKHDPEQLERMVTMIHISAVGIAYDLNCGSECRYHFELEITNEKVY